ncbi:MAG: lipocalin-like domain-containing protein [Ramlibacter sp.]
MLRRRSVLGAASVAAGSPLLLLAGCGGGSDDLPIPIPASASALHFPTDLYLHLGAPTEWWWHTGTLKAGSRVFGFEINAASFKKDGLGFTQVSLSDVANNKHYQSTVPYFPPLMYDPDHWAQADTTKDWTVKLGDVDNRLSTIVVTSGGTGYTSAPKVEITGGGGGILAAATAAINPATGSVAAIVLISPGTGFTSVPTITLTGGGGTGATAKAVHSYVTMQAPATDPTKNMAIKALISDEATGTVVNFDLNMSQQGPKLIVWGTGVLEQPGTSPPLLRNNYYYSLTHLQSTGSISIGTEKINVSGVTWMDHEYGAFGSAANPVKWILQAMQLDNGARIHNYTVAEPALNKRSAGECTVMEADGTIYLVPSFVTPVGRTWKSPQSGRTYFMELFVEIPAFDATFTVKSLMDSQEFPTQGAPVYEGVASTVGTFKGVSASGTAWNEQALG